MERRSREPVVIRTRVTAFAPMLCLSVVGVLVTACARRSEEKPAVPRPDYEIKAPTSAHAKTVERASPEAALPGKLTSVPGNVSAVTNSIGMKLVLIPAGEFLMGSPDSDTKAQPNERPQHRVRITKPFYLGQYEVTVGQFRKFVEDSKYQTEAEKEGERQTWKNASSLQTDEHPVVRVSWTDASEFCRWLRRKEGKRYRLPTEAEWEYACRAGTQTKWSFGDDEKDLGDFAWFGGNSERQVHVVGQKNRNPWGLYDMHGNVGEWCADWYSENYYVSSPSDDPLGPSFAEVLRKRVVRGFSSDDAAHVLRSACRHGDTPWMSFYGRGFRVAMTPELDRATTSDAKAVKKPVPEPVSQSKATTPRANITVETNSVGMNLVLIPAGEFLMGSPDSDRQGQANEKPQHRVRITKPFYLGQHEVTVSQFGQFVSESGYKGAGNNWSGGASVPPSRDNPVMCVTWNDASKFCQWLSVKEGKAYRLPTEAEWEYACRAGAQTRYTFGDDEEDLGDFAWFDGNSRYGPQPVGRRKPNAWGLYDMHGNVWEWCADWYAEDYYLSSPPEDPIGSAPEISRVSRGGSWWCGAPGSRSAFRCGLRPESRGFMDGGFRVARTLDANRGTTGETRTVEESSREPAPLKNATSLPPSLTVETNSIGMNLVLVPAGEFLMGSPDREGSLDERPQHRVRITKPFFLGQHEVTVGQFRQFAQDANYQTEGEKDRYSRNWKTAFSSQSEEHPVVCVTWNDANEFCKWLSAKEGKAYRLPTEAEWEYACRAGTQTRYSFGDDPKDLGKHAWHSGTLTHPVGQKKPNAWALYDMYGNVWEWCADRYDSRYYAWCPLDDPAGPSSGYPGSNRVVRGGSFGGGVTGSAHRDGISPDSNVRGEERGFRAARTP